MPSFTVDPDVRRAAPLPKEVYGDPAIHARIVERVLARSWHFVCDRSAQPPSGHAAPVWLAPGSLDEPLVLTRDDSGTLRCLSNVCTHRGKVVVEAACRGPLRCAYHGRRFGLDGRMLSAPGFDGAVGFPSALDDLPAVPFASFGSLGFASLFPRVSFEEVVAPVRERIRWAVEASVPDPGSATDYEVDASWLLYVDNFLEGFHVPFVHPALAAAVDPTSYEVETHAWCSVQVARAKAGEPALEPPEGHPDRGARIAALYVWLFPATMLNVYPWGVSLNAVRPLGPARTRVEFRSYVRDASLRERGAGAGLHRVELEDEAVVGSTQRGVRSRLYRRGRFAPLHEAGVHGFHRAIAAALEE